MIRLKSLLNEDVDWYIREDGDWNYSKIESSKSARDIAQLLRRSRGIFNDDEAVAEAAFIAMTKSNIYDAVKKSLSRDPYGYVSSFISTGNMYHKQSIDTSYRKILANKKKASTTAAATTTPAPSGNPMTQSFKNLIKSWENSKSYKPGGWNPKKEKWYPHKSPEGGTPTIAYGHKLTEQDVLTGKFKNGLTDSEALRLFDSDLLTAQNKAMKLIPKFAKLPTATKQALINSCYRGEMSNEKMPKTLKLMRDGKWKEAAAEYLDNEEYREAGANVRGRMEWNARQFAATSKFGFVS
jgi:hypothetical protein